VIKIIVTVGKQKLTFALDADLAGQAPDPALPGAIGDTGPEQAHEQHEQADDD
jgi:hypothetical protein